MDSKEVEQLLEKYWNCETSLEEEEQLRRYLTGENVPLRWKETSELFRYFDQQKGNAITGGSFDADVVRRLQVDAPAGKRVSLWHNYGRIAAGLLVVVAATYFVRQEVRKSYPKEIADTYTDPKVAFEETKKALMMISGGFGKAQKETNKINISGRREKSPG